MPGMPEKRAFFHLKTTDAAAGAGKIHRLAVQCGTCHRTEISVFHAALPAGTGMEPTGLYDLQTDHVQLDAPQHGRLACAGI